MVSPQHEKLLEDNLNATNELSKQVHTLSEKFSAKEILHRRTRRLTWLAVVLAILSVLGMVGSSIAIYQNWHTAKVSCLNANETREFQYKAWLYVLGQELTDRSSKQNNVEAQMAANILPVMKKGWRPRDCDNLDKPYPIEMPPTPDNVPNELLWGTDE